MIEVDYACYGTVVRVRSGNNVVEFDLPPGLLDPGPVIQRPAADLIFAINRALRVLQGGADAANVG